MTRCMPTERIAGRGQTERTRRWRVAFAMPLLTVPALTLAQAGGQAAAEDLVDGTQCNAATFLPGIAPVSAGGVTSLKTKWITAYTQPLNLTTSPSERKPVLSKKNLTAVSIAFGTNTFADLKDPTPQQLVFRDSAVYNLAFSWVGLRTAKSSTPSRFDEIANRIFAAGAAAAKLMQAKEPKNAAGAAAAAKKAVDDAQKQYAADFNTARDGGNAALKAGGNDISKFPAAENKKIEDLKADAESAEKARAWVVATAEATAANHPDSARSVTAALEEQAGAILQKTADLDCKDPITNHRLFQTDRYYYSGNLSKADSKFFFSNGVVARSVATSADGEAKSGLLTAYVGMGIDGPLYTMLNSKSQGFASTELFVAYNRMTRSGVSNLFARTDLPRQFGTYGVNFEFALQDQLSVKIAYGRGFGRLGKEVGDLVMTSIVMQR